METGQSIETRSTVVIRSSSSLPQRWRWPLIVTLVCLAVTVAVYSQTVRSLVVTWYVSNTYSHGFLILPISLWLVWMRRNRLILLLPAPTAWGLAPLAGLAFGWLLGNLASVRVVEELAFVAILPVLIWTLLGTSTAWAMFFPLAFLLFAVPMGEDLVPPLQDLTAAFAVRGLELVGVPVVLEGRYLSVPSGTWEVAEACAGVRYLIAMVALGSAFAVLAYHSWRRRLPFLAASIVVPVLANGARAFGIVLIGHLSNNRLAAGVDHIIYGWIFFGVVMTLLFAVGWRWREEPLGGGGEPRALEGLSNGDSSPASLRRWLVVAGLALLVLSAAPLMARRLADAGETPQISLAEPPVSPPWVSLEEYAGRWHPRFRGASAEVIRTFTSAEQQVHVFVAYYADHWEDAELISGANQLYDPTNWRRLAEGTAQIAVEGQTISIHETVLRSGQSTRLIWSWYWVDGEFTASPYRAKYLQVRAKLLGGSRASAVVAVGADFSPDKSDAANALQDFLGHYRLGKHLNVQGR